MAYVEYINREKMMLTTCGKIVCVCVGGGGRGVNSFTLAASRSFFPYKNIVMIVLLLEHLVFSMQISTVVNCVTHSN